MRLGIFAKTFSGTDPRTVLTAVSEAGFPCTQFNMACCGLPSLPDRITPEITSAVAAAADRVGVEISALSGTYNMIHPDPAERAWGLARLDVLASSCAGLGTRLITLCTGTRDPDDQWRHHAANRDESAWRDLLREMTEAIEIADRFDIELGIEPELANVVNSAATARRLIDELGSPRLRIVFDAANLFETASLADQRRLA